MPELRLSVVKPPFRVPTMEEVRAIPWNGLTVASLFSGGGGSSLGYRMAGFRVAYANEFVEAARDTYRANASPSTYLDGRDVREVTGQSIRELAGVEVDLLDGSPPCASFSLAGAREKGWGKVKEYSDVEQRTDDLFFEYARVVRELRPRAFVAENVAGLVIGKAKGYFIRIIAELKAAGYRVSARVVDAQWVGVPQRRRRVIFVGVREDLGVDPVHPRPLPFRYSAREALAALPDPTDEDLLDAAIRTRTAFYRWNNVPLGASANEGAYRQFYFWRVDPEEPVPTVIASMGPRGGMGLYHWATPRAFTIPEYRRVCSFPDDFALTGDYAQKVERLGRSVPPLMMRAIASGVAELLGGPR